MSIWDRLPAPFARRNDKLSSDGAEAGGETTPSPGAGSETAPREPEAAADTSPHTPPLDDAAELSETELTPDETAHTAEVPGTGSDDDVAEPTPIDDGQIQGPPAPVPARRSLRTYLRRRPRSDGDDVEFGIAGPEAPQRRRGLIPSWLPWAAGAVGAAFLVLVLVILFWPGGGSVRVPDLTGLDRAAATERVRVLGLKLSVADTRFSDTVPSGHILTQTPKKGAFVAEGSVVTVDISAGSETFAMPDVIGQKLDAARRTLRDRGLDVTFVTIASDGVPGTVVSSVPAANTTVTIGDLVRLSVSAGVGATGTVVPTDLSGLTFVLDPALAPAASTSDVTFDVARRVRALLEAADARVVLTRSVSDTADTATIADRIRRSRESTSTALVGLGVATSGAVGLQVQSLPTTGTPPAVHAASDELASALVTALRADFASTTTTYAVGDSVLKDYGGTAARIRLGSNASNADRLNFADPAWADSVARAIFNALARTYGRS
jgi:hypothetical protein